MREPPPAVDIPSVVARRSELVRLQAFVAPPSPFTAGALLIEGPAGIGKSTLWRAAVSLAAHAGRTVLAAASVERERQLSFAAVADLLSPLLDTVVPALPAPQRHALRVALLLEPPAGPPPGTRAIATAVLVAIQRAARERPVVLAVDDEAALDDASRAVLDYVIRRLGDAPVRILVSRRATGIEPPPLGLRDGVQRLVLEPFGVGATHRLLAQQLQRSFPRPVVRRLHEVSGGNPYYALELGRVVVQRHARLHPDDPLPVPESLAQLVQERFASLAAPTRELVELVTTVFDPRTALIVALARQDGLGGEVDVAAAAGALREEGDRLQVAHPVLGAAVYSQIGPERRRALHARLADGGEPGDEARALHLGLATAEPDARVADELAAAAARARGRGAMATAARIMERAARLTPPADVARVFELTMVSAVCWIAAGDHARARALALEQVDQPGLGPRRAEVLYMLAWTLGESDSLADASRLADDALAHVEDHMELEARIRLGAAYFDQARGRLGQAAEHARLAVASAQAGSDADTLALALTVEGMGTVLRRGTLTPQARRGLDAAQEWGTGPTQGRSMLVAAAMLLATGDLDGARLRLEELRALAIRAGHEPRLGHVLGQLAEVERRAGRWAQAREASDEARELAEQGMLRQAMAAALMPGAMLDAAAGRDRAARTAANAGLEIAEAVGDELCAIQHRGALGLLELSHGRPADARAWLIPAAETTIRFGIAPGVHQVVLDAAEVALACDDLFHAERFIAHLEAYAAVGDAWTQGAALRARGLAAAHDRDLARAQELIVDAVAAHERAGQPFHLARTLVALGSIERRRKQKRASRAALERAESLFAELPARPWQARVAAELARLGRRAEPDALTVTEARIAELAAAGLSNPEIAAEVFVSRKTVEANLSKIYRKLGVRSRVELVRRLPQ